MDSAVLAHPRIFLSACAKVAVIRILDTLMLAVAAWLTLSPDVSSIEIAMLLVVLASAMLGGAE